jgi:RES domain-containing protein
MMTYLNGGRWNSAGKRVIYAAQTYAGALLEVLVHANLGIVPKTKLSSKWTRQFRLTFAGCNRQTI